MSWITKIGKNLKELRIIISPSRNSDAQLFAHKYVPLFRQHNPSFPFIVRECDGVDEFMVMTYDYGVEKKELISNKSVNDIEQIIENGINNAKNVNQTL